MDNIDTEKTIERIKSQIKNNDALLYMKGTPQFPMCGFSARVVSALKEHKANFSYVNVLENPDIRAELPAVANWPTFPQLWIKGELIGGCDIVMDMYESNELLELLTSESLVGEKSSNITEA